MFLASNQSQSSHLLCHIYRDVPRTKKKTKEPTHLIKHDFEVIKLSGKTEKDELRLNIGTQASKYQNC